MSTNQLTLLPNDIVKITIIGCKNLVAADSNGSSDGYVVIDSFIPNNAAVNLLQEKNFKTSVKKKNLNPTWNESFLMPALGEAVDYVKIKVTVMDYDLLSKDDFLGSAEFIIDNSYGNEEKMITAKLNGVDHGEITVGITIQRSTENLEIDTYRNEILSTIPSTRYTIHKGKRFLHFQCPNFFVIDKDESQESQRILLRCGESNTLQFYILENGNDYPYHMSKEKVLSLITYVEQYRSHYEIEHTELSVKPFNYFGLNTKIDKLEETKFHNELNGKLRFGKVLIFDQLELPYCIAAMMLTSDEEDNYKNKVLIDFILNSIQFEEKE